MQVQLLVRNVTSKTQVRSSSGSPKLTHSCESVGAVTGGTSRRYRLRAPPLLISLPRGPTDTRVSPTRGERRRVGDPSRRRQSGRQRQHALRQPALISPLDRCRSARTPGGERVVRSLTRDRPV